MSREREPVGPAGLTRLDVLASRRLAGEPVARIAGEKEFYGLPFTLVPETLVPRPETEMLVDLGLEVLPLKAPARILDIGTGTGCIAIALLVHRPEAKAVGVDLSSEACACARANAERHGVSDRFDSRTGSWFAPVADSERFELIVSNPPYIESAEIAALSREVREFDPLLALDGGPDGLAPYREIAKAAPRFLSPGGSLAIEIGANQSGPVAALLEGAGLKAVAVKKDLAGLDRMVVAHHV